ncbi:hypothetical protein [Virgibacillus kimchii]
MKARYLIVLCLLALLANAFSIYNYLLAICTLFLLLLLFIPSLFIKMTSAANNMGADKQNFFVRQIGNYGKQKATRRVNRFAIIFSLIVVNLAAISLTIITYLNLHNTARFISRHITWEVVTPLLGITGFVLFIASVLLVTVYAVKIVKKEALFRA